MLIPLVSRVCTHARVKPVEDRSSAVSDYRKKQCLKAYDECVIPCPGEPDDDLMTEAEQICLDDCYEKYEQCLLDDDRGGPSCEPEAGYCGYDEYDYGDYSSDDSSASDWSCDSSDDSYDYSDDSSSDWSCETTDSSDDGYSDDDGGWDCSSDNADDSDSDSDGGEWGEDWGERSPAGGDGIDSPLDLPH
jgi:hypothetical protein